ncbi:MAG: 3-phosphoshikimate 1-carboxyvinyltransferase, partial [Muribaculaceae bacterium]|nr:3-phosphoshikimate 1-carboxyvinyltransferase [Muribaculaceae bacterium]
MDYRIFPPESILETTVGLPASKSLITRAMVMNAVAGHSAVEGLGNAADTCDDTRTLASILSVGLPSDGSTVDVGPAGTAMRFLCALAAATEGTHCVLTGTERMLRRPIGPLVESLRALGADIEYIGQESYPPLKIRGRRLSGGVIRIDAAESSQFISALMMVTPLMASPLSIHLRGNVQSLPYIRMTAGMMQRRGIAVEVERDFINVPAAPYIYESDAEIEPDWSAAAFWYEIAALTAGWVTLPGLRADSLQGDSAEAALFERLGVLTEFTADGAELSATPDLFSHLDADMSDMPDAVPALVVTACMAGVRFELTGVGALRKKESDRLEALVTEMRRLGMDLEIDGYGTVLRWDGTRRPIAELPVFDTYRDHRMAMALAPVAVFVPGIVVRDIEVVDKS